MGTLRIVALLVAGLGLAVGCSGDIFGSSSETVTVLSAPGLDGYVRSDGGFHRVSHPGPHRQDDR